MRIYKILPILMIYCGIFLVSCDEPDSFSSIPETGKSELREWAGTLARFYVLPPCDSLRPEKPDSTELLALIESCNANPEAWAYLYSCIAESIAVIEPPLPSCQ